MSITLNLPELSDKELENLYGNAIRLSQSGTQPQKSAAEEMLPRVGEEIQRRRSAHLSAVSRKREEAMTARRAKAKSAKTQPGKTGADKKAREKKPA
jgi:hypothetical protein